MNAATRNIVLAFACTILFGPFQTISGQTDVVVAGDSTVCPCSIALEPYVVLRDSDGRAGLSYPLALEQTGAGGFLVVPSVQQGALLLFDAEGRFLRRVGRPGQGPGEFRSVLDLDRTSGDSIVVLDPGNGRLTILDPGLQRPSRSERLPIMSGQMAVLNNGEVVLLGTVTLTPRVQVFSRSMEPLASFLEGYTGGGPAPLGQRRLAAGSAGGHGLVAVAHVGSDSVEIWSSDGQHLRTLTRAGGLATEPSRTSHGDESASPPPRQEGPHFDAEGRLWTRVLVPDRNGTSALDSVQGLRGPMIGLRSGSQDDYFDSLIEVLDPIGGEVLASGRVDPAILFFLDGGLAASYREDEIGDPVIEIWKLALRPR